MTKLTEDELERLRKSNPDLGIPEIERSAAEHLREREQGIVPASLIREQMQAAWDAIGSAPSPLEGAEQKAVFDWAEAAQAQYPMLQWMVHVPNGGKRDARTAAIMKGQGVKRGVPDIVLFHPVGGFAGLAIELKRADGKPSDLTPEQRDWVGHLREANWYTAVCFGANDAIYVIERYCKGETERASL
jgi:hypothetical protein